MLFWNEIWIDFFFGNRKIQYKQNGKTNLMVLEAIIFSSATIPVL